jgi:hypothetical protein
MPITQSQATAFQLVVTVGAAVIPVAVSTFKQLQAILKEADAPPETYAAIEAAYETLIEARLREAAAHGHPVEG